ncbi:hypothetical protein [Brevundimonas sp.]|uniref:hypothetical protein n=1 Tax=Brevundimonas sp. TaxID=1871086 RepID=UPI002D5F6C44|nr:hypothetical protein [Brevundimonas sp.]HYC96827.1 hypothetical protein [Brevundimonas sp.]
MRSEPEREAEDGDRRTAELARIAKELVDYGFYVRGELLPDENKLVPSREPKPGPSGRG